MAKEQRSSLNPFTGKSHFDIVNDDKFLEDSYRQYYAMVQKAQVLDNAPEGQVVRAVAVRLIKAVDAYLTKIDRMDYIKDYYDWDVHLLADKTVNAFCMPGGKIVMFSGILSIANTEERIAFILGHEMAHALLDHSRTRASVESAKNTIATATYFGSFLLDIFGMGAVGDIRLGMLIIHWAGYDINAIPAFWENMSQNAGNNFEFFSTHPSDEKRIANMKALIAEINSDKDFTSAPVIGEPTVTDKTNNWSNQTKQAPKANACPKCGAAIAPEDNFCTNCGQKIK